MWYGVDGSLRTPGLLLSHLMPCLMCGESRRNLGWGSVVLKAISQDETERGRGRLRALLSGLWIDFQEAGVSTDHMLS